LKYPREQQHPHPHAMIIISIAIEIPNARYYPPDIYTTCLYFIKSKLSYIILFGPPFNTTTIVKNNGIKEVMINVKINVLNFEIYSQILFKFSFLVIILLLCFSARFLSNYFYLNK
jgi:hypothetical protein